MYRPVAGLLLAASLAPLGAEARPQYVDRVPTTFGCETCHEDPRDRLNRNGFGIEFALLRGVWVNANNPAEGLCWNDSDFDGIANGVELNDPACVWRPGNPLPGPPTTHPGDPRDPDQCGDGVIQFAEACDDEAIETSCVDEGFVGGEVRCFDDCTLDLRGCEAPPPPDMAIPDMMVPDMAEPDMAEPDMAEPDMAEPDMAEPAQDTGPLDMAAADVSEADMGPADAQGSDAALEPDGSMSPDSGLADADGAAPPAADAGAEVSTDGEGCWVTPGARPTHSAPLWAVLGLWVVRRRGRA